ncbi:MAG: hypothetical protein LIO91_03635 [Bacteroidales bacterium]|nr:hypothetical protein [Bacteroidales bacterium]
MDNGKEKRKYSKYSLSLAKTTEEWVAQHGLVDYEGASVYSLLEFLGVSDNTYYKWKKVHTEFAEGIERGKEQYKTAKASKLERSLFKASEGGFVEEETETTEYVPSANPERPQIRKMVRTKNKKYIKPDVGAAIFLLTNLAPETYQNRRNAEVKVSKGKEQEMTLDELNAEIARLSKPDSNEE